MKSKKQYNDDDGRTIADMSGISRTPLIVPKPSGKDGKETADSSEKEPENQLNLSRSERRSFVFGALSASVLIGLIFAAVFAAVILLIIFIGK